MTKDNYESREEDSRKNEEVVNAKRTAEKNLARYRQERQGPGGEIK